MHGSAPGAHTLLGGERRGGVLGQDLAHRKQTLPAMGFSGGRALLSWRPLPQKAKEGNQLPTSTFSWSLRAQSLLYCCLSLYSCVKG